MKTNIRYQVVTRRPIAVEMCRYEHGKIISEKLVKKSPYTDEYYDDDTYEFQIESSYCNVSRWKSFDVTPIL